MKMKKNHRVSGALKHFFKIQQETASTSLSRPDNGQKLRLSSKSSVMLETHDPNCMFENLPHDNCDVVLNKPADVIPADEKQIISDLQSNLEVCYSRLRNMQHEQKSNIEKMHNMYVIHRPLIIRNSSH